MWYKGDKCSPICCCRSRRVNGCHKAQISVMMWLKARWPVKWMKRSWDLMMWVMTDEPLLYLYSCPFYFYLFMFACFTWRTANTTASLHGEIASLHGEQSVLSLWRKLVSVAAHQCAALTYRAVCRRVDIVASFKLPSVDVRLGANEAPGDAVRVRLSYASHILCAQR